MRIQLVGGMVYDPAQNLSGEVRDIVFDGETIIAADESRPADFHYDLSGHIVMAGAIDLHTHIGGGKAAIARMLLPEWMESRPARANGSHLRDPLLMQRQDSFLPPAPMVGRRYIEMGYTACFEPAMLPCNARGTYAELADTPLIDSGAYVVLGNDDVLLAMMRDRVDKKWIHAYVAAMVDATRAMGVKVVNAGGINAFKYNQRQLNVDTPHPVYGITPSAIIRTLAEAVDTIGIPQPLHVHASNLGMAGNIESTLKTIEAANGHRLHLTHVQFHSYGSDGPRGFSSGAERLVRALQSHPNITIDVGQVMFGQTVTISADSMHQFAARHLAKPRKSVILDIECEAGCGVIPFRYENRRYVNALQWAIGLEIFLMMDDPSRVFLTTDHPNGGPFTTYPHLMRLLMDPAYRSTALAEIDGDAADASQLSGFSRAYTLSDMAMMTRLAPARFLGLSNLGHLKPGAIADISIFREGPDWETTFRSPTHVFRRGRLVVRDGCLIDSTPAVIHSLKPSYDVAVLPKIAPYFERQGRLSPWNFPITDDELVTHIGGRPQLHLCGPH